MKLYSRVELFYNFPDSQMCYLPLNVQRAINTRGSIEILTFGGVIMSRGIVLRRRETCRSRMINRQRFRVTILLHYLVSKRGTSTLYYLQYRLLSYGGAQCVGLSRPIYRPPQKNGWRRIALDFHSHRALAMRRLFCVIHIVRQLGDRISAPSCGISHEVPVYRKETCNDAI